jgi:hypothetical protein
MIRIDVHPTRENPTIMTRTLLMPVHVHPAYASYGRSPHVATFREVINSDGQSTAPEKKGSGHNPQHPDWPIRRFIPIFSPKATIKAVGGGGKATLCWR